ncbi:hypothetical protein [Pseudactinotalea sp. HY158]|uniref:hypothetical protein n=1 Tax=Pseudactinotalea sp. HY158 TaxID=2654547 RepID=UPI00129C3315|nr:hypothetical protein [Pseudactinotalea sp. HY158]QGH68626.1 hypothetical protein GCE65_03220 [Pseudactinotalea sp. HY158]
MAAAACAAAALTLTVGLGASGTDAAWRASERAEATFTAASLNTVNDLECKSGGLFGLGNRQVKLSWSPPDDAPAGAKLTYLVTWTRPGGESRAAVVDSTEYTLSPENITLGLTLTASVSVQLGPWTSAAVTENLLAVNVLVGLVLTCMGPPA